MIKFLEIVGYIIIGMIPAAIIIYVLSRVQARGWIDSIESYINKLNFKNDEQTKEE